MTPSSLMTDWLAARTVPAVREILSAAELQVPRAAWRAFWTAYSPLDQADRRSPAARFIAEQAAAAERALAVATTESPRLQVAVARTYTRDYWLDVYGRVEREAVARRQARHLVSLAAPGWAADPTWRTSTVLALVKVMLGSGDFSTTPILADALQDAGCDSDEWLLLLRDPAQPWFAGARLFDTLP
ncbi:MAG: hypothetical protein ACKODX_18360 [Gemmata sp.]